MTETLVDDLIDGMVEAAKYPKDKLGIARNLLYMAKNIMDDVSEGEGRQDRRLEEALLAAEFSYSFLNKCETINREEL